MERARNLIAIVLCALLLPGCIIEREPPEEEEEPAEAPPVVPRYSRPLRVVEVFPPPDTQGVARNTTLYVSFDQYLDADRLLYFDTFRLRSGGLRASEVSSYEMVDKRVVARLTAALDPSLIYTLELNPDVLRSVEGSPYLGEPELAVYLTGEDFLDLVEAEPPPTWTEDIEPLIERGCSCHRMDPLPEDSFRIPWLGYDQIVGQPSWERPELRIVEPFDPPRSVLMHKLLEDYPVRVGTAMPPPWANTVALDFEVRAEPLSRDELRLVERWIRTGAAR